MPGTYDQFFLESDFELRGDQPRAIDQLVDGLTRKLQPGKAMSLVPRPSRRALLGFRGGPCAQVYGLAASETPGWRRITWLHRPVMTRNS